MTPLRPGQFEARNLLLVNQQRCMSTKKDDDNYSSQFEKLVNQASKERSQAEKEELEKAAEAKKQADE